MTDQTNARLAAGARSPRDLLTEDERDRCRAFGIPPVLMFAARGRPQCGVFEALPRGSQGLRYRFMWAEISDDGLWATMFGLESAEMSISESRIADLEGVTAIGVFHLNHDGTIEPAIDIAWTPPGEPPGAGTFSSGAITSGHPGLPSGEFQRVAGIVDILNEAASK